MVSRKGKGSAREGEVKPLKLKQSASGLLYKEDIITTSILAALLIAGGCWFYFYALQTDRYITTEFCKPRGYVGGFIRNNHELGCVARDGRHVLIRDIQHAEKARP
jgi:hypothetical protein